ncbi:hypothetical protein, partial [Ramlibacter sp.]|uniref:hypothetical protein n=1 Tax=Ramlibacter sp. TaxID=1917967 RepID=UPI002D2E67BF
MTTRKRAWMPAPRLARVAGCALLLAFTLHAGPPVSLAQPAPVQAAPQEVSRAPDALGRDSPLGTVTGFSRAVHRGELMLASRYLQLGARSSRQGEALAEDLGTVLDRYFTRSLTSLSPNPNGRLDDGLPADREKLTLTVGDREVDLFLVRVREPGQGDAWLVSSESLARVPDLRRQERGSWLEERMPEWLQRGTWLGATPAQWLMWTGSLLLPLAA